MNAEVDCECQAAKSSAQEGSEVSSTLQLGVGEYIHISLMSFRVLTARIIPFDEGQLSKWRQVYPISADLT